MLLHCKSSSIWMTAYINRKGMSEGVKCLLVGLQRPWQQMKSQANQIYLYIKQWFLKKCPLCKLKRIWHALNVSWKSPFSDNNHFLACWTGRANRSKPSLISQSIKWEPSESKTQYIENHKTSSVCKRCPIMEYSAIAQWPRYMVI